MQKESGFIHFLLILFVGILLLVATFFIGLNKKESLPILPDISQSQNISSEEVVGWNIPEIPSEYNWKTKYLTKEDEGAKRYSMHSVSTGNDRIYERIPFPATVYYTDMTYDDPKEIPDTRQFGYNFTEKMANTGWEFMVNYRDITISGISADGVFSSSYGHIKMKDSIIRSIGYSYKLFPSSWGGPGSEVVCPCRLHLEIFIGDEIDLKEL